MLSSPSPLSWPGDAPWPPNGYPNMMFGPWWPQPLVPGQAVCAAGLYNVTDLCCELGSGAMWVGDNRYARSHSGARQHMCLLYSNVTTANWTIADFADCMSDLFDMGSPNRISWCMILWSVGPPSAPPPPGFGTLLWVAMRWWLALLGVPTGSRGVMGNGGMSGQNLGKELATYHHWGSGQFLSDSVDNGSTPPTPFVYSAETNNDTTASYGQGTSRPTQTSSARRRAVVALGALWVVTGCVLAL